MAEPGLEPCAALVRRADPDLFHAGLFAPPGVRGDLMVLAAFDIALGQAAARPGEPLIAAMRLQWWRDLVAGIRAGEAARAHEVAGPLHGVLTRWPGAPWALLEALIAAREAELEGPMDRARFEAWGAARFGALVALGLERLAGPGVGLAPDAAAGSGLAVGAAAGGAGGGGVLSDLAAAAGRVLALGFALRTAVAMAARSDRAMLPIAAADRTALARGETGEPVRALARDLAAAGLADLARARAAGAPRAAVPALLPLWRAERVLRAARAPGFDLVRDLAPVVAARAALPMLWRAARGRW